MCNRGRCKIGRCKLKTQFTSLNDFILLKKPTIIVTMTQQPSDDSGETKAWRMQVWKALKTDDAELFGLLFPDAQDVRRASRDMWKPREPARDKPLIDVVASVRNHINSRRPAIQCLRWLLAAHPTPSVYTARDISYVINRNAYEMERDPTTRDGYTEINTLLAEHLNAREAVPGQGDEHARRAEQEQEQ